MKSLKSPFFALDGARRACDRLIMSILRDLVTSYRPMACFVAIGFGWAAYAAQVPVLKAQIDASDAMFGTVMLLAAIGAVMAMWLAPLAHRFAGRAALVVGALGMAVGFLFSGFAGGALGFGLAMALAAMGSGVADVLANAEISELEADTQRSLMNLNHAAFSFAYAFSALLVGGARDAGWSPMAVFTVLAVAVALLCFVMRTPDRSRAQAQSVPTSMPHMLVWLAGIIVFVAFLGEASTEGWSALHLERTLGGGAAEGAFGPAILGLTMGFGRLFGHFLANRMRPLMLIGLAMALAAFGTALAGAAPSLAVAYLGFGVAGFGVSVVAPLALALVGSTVPPAVRLKAISRAAALGYAAFFAGPPMMGFVAEFYGLRVSFYVISAVLAVVITVVLPLLAAQVRQAKR